MNSDRYTLNLSDSCYQFFWGNLGSPRKIDLQLPSCRDQVMHRQMGYYVKYSVKLRIRSADIQKALEILNQLHTPEMLVKHAHGGIWPKDNKPIDQIYWYSWVTNPTTPYKTLTEAFTNWGIVDKNTVYEVKNGDFIVSGDYDDKLGQQEFLIQQLASVLCNTCIHIVGEDNRHCYWIVDDHQYKTIDWKDVGDGDDGDDGDEGGEDVVGK